MVWCRQTARGFRLDPFVRQSLDQLAHIATSRQHIAACELVSVVGEVSETPICLNFHPLARVPFARIPGDDAEKVMRLIMGNH